MDRKQIAATYQPQLTRTFLCSIFSPVAQMAELVDALGSGPSGSNTVQVRVLFWASLLISCIIRNYIVRFWVLKHRQKHWKKSIVKDCQRQKRTLVSFCIWEMSEMDRIKKETKTIKNFPINIMASLLANLIIELVKILLRFFRNCKNVGLWRKFSS